MTLEIHKIENGGRRAMKNISGKSGGGLCRLR
jgi:hypothetical protein